VPTAEYLSEEWTLYCACGTPPVSSRWNWNELKLCFVSKQAHARGYGLSEEIVACAAFDGEGDLGGPTYI
jgi:hypothetical protein